MSEATPNNRDKEIKELEALDDVLEVINSKEEIGNATEEEIAHAELIRRMLLLEHEKVSGNATKEDIKRMEENVELSRKTVADLEKNAKNTGLKTDKVESIAKTPISKDAPAVAGLETATASMDAKKKIEADKVELKKLEEKIKAIKKRLAEIDRELAVIRAEKKVKKEMEPKMPETKTFSSDFIKDRIKSLLGSVEAVKEIKNIEVKGDGNEIKITLAITGKKSIITVNIDANMVLENIENGIAVKNYQINSSKFQDMIEGAIAPKLGKVPELVKSFIEKEEGKKVAKTEIKNGKLKVTFA